ncbi:MAG: hypothetical protein HY056_01925 [Proteobacteria bacterium]|nr:hypothetical protein [Pseudomonadota bacterium]
MGARVAAAPEALLVTLWLGILVMLAIGPIAYPGQPSVAALLVIAAGIVMFVIGCAAGRTTARMLQPRTAQLPAATPRLLNAVVAATAILGILGIALIAIDREFLSGIDNRDYATLLRCAPEFVEYVKIRRTPLIYIGYLTFSFGFASLALFLLRAETVRPWPAYLAQFAIVSPIVYALIYSGRMPILLMITLLATVGLVRRCQGLPLLPRGHHLGLKALIVVVAFAIYASATWASRRDFCTQTEALVHELRQKLAAPHAAARPAGARSESIAPEPRKNISAKSLTDMIEKAQDAQLAPSAGKDQKLHSGGNAGWQQLIAIMRQAWGVQPRHYVLTAVERGIVAPQVAVILMNNYFYLTHSVMIVDRIWLAREHLTPVWGVYQISALSPLIRIYFPESKVLLDMRLQMRKANIDGFFPSAWGAAFVDFGAVGGSVYILIWGLMGGWAYGACRGTHLATPALLLAFVLAMVMLSPVVGPLGSANSALVLISMLIVGLYLDLVSAFRNTKAVEASTTVAGAT